MQLDMGGIILAIIGTTGIIVTAILSWRIGKGKNQVDAQKVKVDAESMEIQAQAQADSTYGRIIASLTQELNRMTEKVTTLEQRLDKQAVKIEVLEGTIVELRKALEATSAKDRLIEALNIKAEQLAVELTHRQTVIDQLSSAHLEVLSKLGQSGPAGVAGVAGAAGPTGASGVAGPAGPSGESGATGPAGPSGKSGPTGATGMPGMTCQER